MMYGGGAYGGLSYGGGGGTILITATGIFPASWLKGVSSTTTDPESWLKEIIAYGIFPVSWEESVSLTDLKSELDLIKAKTDNLPTDPASNTEVATRLATSAYTAPDNASIASILTIVTLLQKYVKNKKEIKMVGGVNHLYIYDNDGTTALIDKTLKDPSGSDITAIVAGALALEGASSV